MKADLRRDDGAKTGAPGAPTKSRPGGDHRQSAFGDPLSTLPETAQKLLLAAKRIIVTDGFAALTLNAVAAESGENKAMISYYFGNKAGLVAAVLDSVIHDEYIASRSRLKHLGAGPRRQQLIGEMRRMTEAGEEFLVFFELLPHVLRDEMLRRRLAMLYRWYWGAKLEWLGVASASETLEDPDLLGLTQLLSAVIDGLAVQVAIDPHFDVANPYRVLERMLGGALAALPDGKAGGDGASVPDRVPHTPSA
jgi:AcrR family transcriptional regulator